MKRTAFCFIAGLFVQPALAGVYVELVDRDVRTGTSQVAQKMYVQGDRGRFVDEGRRASMIKGNTLYIIDESDQTYIVFDKPAMQELAKKISAAMEQMKEQLAKMPPEERANAELMLGAMPGMSGEKYTVEALDTGKS